MSALDLYSISQTFCIYGAPYIAVQREGKYYAVYQACCNHWDCPRCGLVRAKTEYARIVYGIELLSSNHTLFFITITCKGLSLSVDEAEESYLGWTNRLLTNMRKKQKVNGKDWYYVQVTERQKRGHPHSHILTVFDPGDTYEGFVEKWKISDGTPYLILKPALRSDWLQKAVKKAGLGDQYDISVVRSASGASRYVAKYLFKDTMFSLQWRKGWNRVRYSQKFPKLPEKETNAFVLLCASDWSKLANVASVIITDCPQTREQCVCWLSRADVLIS